MTNKLEPVIWEDCSVSVQILHRLYSQGTLVTQLHTATRYCSADFIDVYILIWESLRLGEELFQNYTLASLQNTSPYTDIHREEW